MSRTHSRAEMSELAKAELISVLARQARLTDHAVLKAKFKSLSNCHISWLRNEQAEHFGWERLLLIAEGFGIDVAPIFARAQSQSERVAA